MDAAAEQRHQRNSLIIMNVAKNSPRAKTDSVSPAPVANGNVFFNNEVPVETPKPVVHDGHYFLHVVSQTQTEIERELDKIEADMDAHGPSMHDDVLGNLCTTVGMAKLLMREKFEQFRRLCELNIEHHAGGRQVELKEMAEDPEKFASGDDLAGFWAMVNLQVENVRKMFVDAKRYKDNGWQPIAPRRHSVATGPSKSSVRKPRNPIQPLTEEGSAASQARQLALQEQRKAARERMLKAKQEMMVKKRELQANGSADNAAFLIL
ncbi:hypothetical protein Ciccas_014059 [Cichlidogyrus casuarinus]|uniref:Uncharacterized protein n=1 Tax=Cichlidogyrus casuarinus TaxID=1844966 RepID=A0ABD2PJ17_9PLAT